MWEVNLRRNDLLLTFLSALLLAVSRLPLHLGWLVFIAWIPLLQVFERGVEKARQLLLMGFIMSLVYVLIVFYWFALVTLPGLIGMVLLYTLVYYLLFLAINRIFRSLPGWRYAGFISLLLTFEWVQNFGETRFPWFNLAYSLADYNILIQMADLGGVVGLSFLILVINILLNSLLPSSQRKVRRADEVSNRRPGVLRGGRGALALILLIMAAWLGYGAYWLKYRQLEEHDARVHVIQPSIDQDVKWVPEQYGKTMQILQDLTLEAAADSARLVIYPEGAITNYLMRVPQAQRDLRAILDTTGVDIFTGFPDFVPAPPEHVNNELSYNAASLFKQDRFYNELYYKNILVPIGERMLWFDLFPFMWKVQFGQANWEFGEKLAYYESDGRHFSPSICYELAFPEIFHRMAIPAGRDSADVTKCDYLVNITNDAWFGTSYGPWLHAVMARFRAVENRIQIYRSANTGISLIVDPKGRYLAKTKLFEVTGITAPLYTCQEIPLIRRIYRYPLFFVILALVLVVFALFRRPVRRL